MHISYYDGDERKKEEIDLSKVKSFSLLNGVIRRRDGFIRRFRKYVLILVEDRAISNLDKMYLDELKSYAKANKFIVEKCPVMEWKITRYGRVERKAVDWTWRRS